MIKVAEDAWLNKYGESIYEYKPFRAIKRQDGNWYVLGTMPEGHLGAPPEAIISKEGEVVKIMPWE